VSVGPFALQADGVGSVPRLPAVGEGESLGAWSRWLFLCSAVYLVIPLFDVPYWGLSLSTPVLVVLVLDTALWRGSAMLRNNFGWLLLGMTIWLGQFLSLAGNVFGGSLQGAPMTSFVWLLKYAFWVSVFMLTSYLVAHEGLGARLIRVLAGAVIGLGVLRVGEGLLLGAIGNGQAVLLQQNSYGWAFSTFTPFALWLAFAGPRRWRVVGVCGLVVLVAAIAVNASRASWIAVAVGVGLTMIGLLMWSPRDRTRVVVWSMMAISVVAVVWVIAPDSWRDPVESRWQTFGNLERDKSYAVRALMIEKAWTMFERSPWFGSGVGSFRQQTAPLNLPPVLRHRAADSYQRRSAHNAYLGLLAESGLLGAVPMVVLLLTLGLGGAVCVRRQALLGETWAIPVLAGFAAMCLHLGMLSGITNTATWFVFGLVAGVIERRRAFRHGTV